MVSVVWVLDLVLFTREPGNEASIVPIHTQLFTGPLLYLYSTCNNYTCATLKQVEQQVQHMQHVTPNAISITRTQRVKISAKNKHQHVYNGTEQAVLKATRQASIHEKYTSVVNQLQN